MIETKSTVSTVKPYYHPALKTAQERLTYSNRQIACDAVVKVC